MNNESFLKRLEDISKGLIDHDFARLRCRHFSFIIYKNRIISIGINSKKTHPTNLKNPKKSIKTGEDFSDQKHTCSELNAILKLKRLTNIQTEKCTLINIRIDRNGKKVLSKPCMSCDNLLKYHNFKNITWTNESGNYISKNKQNKLNI